MSDGGSQGVAVVLVRGCVRGEGGGGGTAGMQYVRGPMSALSVASDGKEEGGGGLLCTAVMRTAVLKQSDCNTAQPNIPQSRTVSHTR